MSSVFTENVENKERIYEVLNELGTPMHLKGHEYLVLGISYLLSVPEHFTVPMTKVLYPEIAKACNSSATRVERAIRHTVETVFLYADDPIIYKYFGNSVNPEKGKVTNAQFMYTLASYIRRHR